MPDESVVQTVARNIKPDFGTNPAADKSQADGTQQWKENFGSPLEQAYGKAKAWLGEHEDKLDEKYLKPFRQGLDNMADDLQQAAETGHTKSGGQLSGPTKALAEGAAAGLRMVPVGKTVGDTAQAVIAPPELKEENLAKKVVEGEGLIYKGEVSPGTGIHMMEHPDHPGITSTVRGEITPANVHSNMERKIKDFGKEYIKPDKASNVYHSTTQPVKNIEHLDASKSKELDAAGPAVYLSRDKKVSEQYAKTSGDAKILQGKIAPETKILHANDSLPAGVKSDLQKAGIKGETYKDVMLNVRQQAGAGDPTSKLKAVQKSVARAGYHGVDNLFPDRDVVAIFGNDILEDKKFTDLVKSNSSSVGEQAKKTANEKGSKSL